MLDERTSFLLEKINELCGESGSRIFEESELLAAFPSVYRMQRDELKRILRHLESGRYLEIQYEEEGVYCLCPLPEGRAYFETLREKRREGARRRGELFLFSALGGFLGALLALLFCLVPILWRGA